MSKAVRVLVTDPISPKGLAALQKDKRFDLQVKLQPSDAVLAAEVPRAQAWLVRSESKVTDKWIKKGKNLRLIGRAGVGVDNIDLKTASESGVLVMNVPGGNTLAATEHTLALLLACARNVPQAHAGMVAGKWERKQWMGTELAGKTLGVVGLGRIGREVAKRAQSFQMRIVAFDPFVTAEHAKTLNVELGSVEDVLKKSDFVTLHASLNDQTRHMINADSIKKMKPGARLINCARGALIDEAALAAALKAGKLRGAALDVFDEEPLPASSPLRGAPNLILTPHLGASTEEAQLKVSYELTDAVIDYFTKGIVRNAVNLPGFDGDILETAGDQLGLAERLGHFLGQIIEGGVQEVRVQCIGDFPEKHRQPVSVAGLRGVLQGFLDESGISWVNAPLVARARGIKLVESAVEPGPGVAKRIGLEVRTEKGVYGVVGNLHPDGGQRLVKLDDLSVDVPLSGTMLVLANQDAPGVIGKVGDILGRHKVNIADMRVGREKPRGQAAMVITVDGEVKPPAIKALRALKPIKRVALVRL